VTVTGRILAKTISTIVRRILLGELA